MPRPYHCKDQLPNIRLGRWQQWAGAWLRTYGCCPYGCDTDLLVEYGQTIVCKQTGEPCPWFQCALQLGATMSEAMRVTGNREMTVEQRLPKLMEFLNDRKDVAGSLISPDRLVSLFCDAMRATPQLINCEPDSILAAFNQCQRYGWELGGALAHAHLIPYGKKATLVPGYRGLVDLVHRAERYSVTTDTAHEGDTFENRGRFDAPLHIQERAITGRPLVAAYSVVVDSATNSIMSRVWWLDDLLAHRDSYSQGWKRNPKPDNPWHVDNQAFAAMCRKTVLLEVIHRGELQLRVEDRRVVEGAKEAETRHSYRQVDDALLVAEGPPDTMGEPDDTPVAKEPTYVPDTLQRFEEAIQRLDDKKQIMAASNEWLKDPTLSVGEKATVAELTESRLQSI